MCRLSLVSIATLPLVVPHPTISPSQWATMPASERLYFLDAPEAHIVAYQDAMRSIRIDEAMRTTVRAVRAREQRQGSRVL